MAATKSKTERKDADTPELSEKTVTVQGLKVTVFTNAMKRLDVIEAMDDLHSERNPFALIAVFKATFGDEGYAAIKEHLASKNDVVEIDHMKDFFEAALKKVTPNS